VAATIAFARVDTLTAQAHGDPILVQAARTTVFHGAFLVGGCFAAFALLLSLVFLPLMRASETETARQPAG
jgi:hypothetical protein